MANAIAPGAPAPHLIVIDGHPTTTSNEVAEHFGKQHMHVMERIRALIAETPSDFNQSNFRLVEYTDGKGERRPAYRLTRDGFALLAMGFTGKRALQFKLAYIAAFNRLEQKLQHQAQPQLKQGQPAKALPAPGQRFTSAQQKEINAHAWALAHEAYTALRTWLQGEMVHALNPDGTAQPNWANTLYASTYKAYLSHGLSREVSHSLCLINIAHRHLTETQAALKAAQTRSTP